MPYTISSLSTVQHNTLRSKTYSIECSLSWKHCSFVVSAGNDMHITPGMQFHAMQHVGKTFRPTTIHTHVCTQGLSGHTETRNFSFFCLERAVHMVMASAAAVASSSKEELDMGMPVRSHTMV